jgi:hypothetical protein
LAHAFKEIATSREPGRIQPWPMILTALAMFSPLSEKNVTGVCRDQRSGQRL